MNLTSGAHNPERETPIISPCNSVFTDQVIFKMKQQQHDINLRRTRKKNIVYNIKLFLASFFSTFSRENGSTVPYACHLRNQKYFCLVSGF